MIAALSLAFAIALPMQVDINAGERSALSLPGLSGEVAKAPWPAAASARDEHPPPGVPPLEGGGVRRLRLEVRRDEWFGNDKLRHFLMSMAVTQFAYGGLRTASAEDDVALPIAVGTAAVAGLGKEVHDARRGRPFSLKDLLWNGAGITVAAFLLGAVR